MSKILKQASSLLLRGHNYINRTLSKRSRVKPRLLNYRSEPSNPRIFHFNGNFVIGGTSQLIADIIEGTSDKYTHQVFVPHIPEPLPYQPLPVSGYGLRDMNALFERLKKDRPDLVHIHYWVRPIHRYFDFGLWYQTVFKICEELSLKVIQNIDVPTQPFKSSCISQNVFVSHYVRDEFNNSDVPSLVIYPGSDLQHFDSGENAILPDNTVGMVYRLDRDKLDDTVIEIFISAVKNKPSLLCYIIGGGYYLEHYKKRVEEEGLKQNFVFTGYVSYLDLPGYYKKLGLVVAPVHDESFGQVTPFAMGMGLPVAGYDTGAMSEILGSKRSLVKTGDHGSLAQLIVDLMNDPTERKTMGLQNRKRAREIFSVEKMIEEYKTLYKLHLA